MELMKGFDYNDKEKQEVILKALFGSKQRI